MAWAGLGNRLSIAKNENKIWQVYGMR
jgi:hypothetical protein